MTIHSKRFTLITNFSSEDAQAKHTVIQHAIDGTNTDLLVCTAVNADTMQTMYNIVINPAAIIYHIDAQYAIILTDSILCGFDVEQQHCVDLSTNSATAVVKQCIVPDDTFLANPSIQSGLVGIGAIMSNNADSMSFDRPVAVILSPTESKQISTDVAHFYIVPKKDIIIEFDLP